MTDPIDPTLPSAYPEPSLGGGLDPSTQLHAEESSSVETEEGNPESEDLAADTEPAEEDEADDEADEEDDEADYEAKDGEDETTVVAGAAGAAAASARRRNCRTELAKPAIVRGARRPSPPARPRQRPPSMSRIERRPSS